MVRGRKRPVELLFNLEHPDDIRNVGEVDEEADGSIPTDDEVDSDEDELQQRFNKMVFCSSDQKTTTTTSLDQRK